jgi:hypothetical protein
VHQPAIVQPIATPHHVFKVDLGPIARVGMADRRIAADDVGRGPARQIGHRDRCPLLARRDGRAMASESASQNEYIRHLAHDI